MEDEPAAGSSYGGGGASPDCIVILRVDLLLALGLLTQKGENIRIGCD